MTEERRQLMQLLAKHCPDNGRAWRSLGLTALLWGAAVAALHVTASYLAVALTALCVLRCFMVFHDAAHSSFFEDVLSNRRLLRVIQYFAGYSSREWTSVHNSHHAHFGDAQVRDASMTVFFSQQELREAPWPLALAHRVLHDPLIFYPFAGLFVFFINKPVRHFPHRWAVPSLIWLVLGRQTAAMYLAAGWLAATVGVMCFHLQHHCNAPYRVASAVERSALDAALQGSTRMRVPFPFSLASFGIEYHHIHHYSVQVPGYRMANCDAEGERLGLWRGVNTVGFQRGFKSLFHTQFEGSRKVADADGTPPRFVSFWPYSALGLQDA